MLVVRVLKISQLTDGGMPLLMTRRTSFQYLPERVFTQTSLAAVAGAVSVSRTIEAGGVARTYFLYASI
jgi:hypothetical protein